MKKEQPTAAEPSEGSRGTPAGGVPGGTPGPWCVYNAPDNRRRIFIVRSEGYEAVYVAELSTDAYGAAPSQRDIDAHLIAAAPDLYAALEALVETAQPHPTRAGYLVLTVNLDRALPQARAALAKARGEKE